MAALASPAAGSGLAQARLLPPSLLPPQVHSQAPDNTWGPCGAAGTRREEGSGQEKWRHLQSARPVSASLPVATVTLRAL